MAGQTNFHLRDGKLVEFDWSSFDVKATQDRILLGNVASVASLTKHDDSEVMKGICKYLEEKKLMGFLHACPKTYNFQDVVEFYNNANVNQGTILSKVKGVYVSLNLEQFCAVFDLPSRGEMDLKVNEEQLKEMFLAHTETGLEEDFKLTMKRNLFSHQFNMLAAVIGKVVECRASGFDTLTHARLSMMFHVYKNLTFNWGKFLFERFHTEIKSFQLTVVKDKLAPVRNAAFGLKVLILLEKKGVTLSVGKIVDSGKIMGYKKTIGVAKGPGKKTKAQESKPIIDLVKKKTAPKEKAVKTAKRKQTVKDSEPEQVTVPEKTKEKEPVSYTRKRAKKASKKIVDEVAQQLSMEEIAVEQITVEELPAEKMTVEETVISPRIPTTNSPTVEEITVEEPTTISQEKEQVESLYLPWLHNMFRTFPLSRTKASASTSSEHPTLMQVDNHVPDFAQLSERFQRWHGIERLRGSEFKEYVEQNGWESYLELEEWAFQFAGKRQFWEALHPNCLNELLKEKAVEWDAAVNEMAKDKPSEPPRPMRIGDPPVVETTAQEPVLVGVSEENKVGEEEEKYKDKEVEEEVVQQEHLLDYDNSDNDKDELDFALPVEDEPHGNEEEGEDVQGQNILEQGGVSEKVAEGGVQQVEKSVEDDVGEQSSENEVDELVVVQGEQSSGSGEQIAVPQSSEQRSAQTDSELALVTLPAQKEDVNLKRKMTPSEWRAIAAAEQAKKRAKKIGVKVASKPSGNSELVGLVKDLAISVKEVQKSVQNVEEKSSKAMSFGQADWKEVVLFMQKGRSDLRTIKENTTFSVAKDYMKESSAFKGVASTIGDLIGKVNSNHVHSLQKHEGLETKLDEGLRRQYSKLDEGLSRQDKKLEEMQQTLATAVNLIQDLLMTQQKSEMRIQELQDAFNSFLNCEEVEKN